MVTALRQFRATTRDITMKLYGHFYGTAAQRPVAKAIYTQSNSAGRAPRLDLILQGKKIQPYIHDAINHRLLPCNNTIKHWNQARVWHGDIVIMRKGNVQEFVSLRGKKDAPLADFAVKKFVERVKQKRSFSIPKSLVFHKA